MLGEYILDPGLSMPGAQGTIRMNNSNICCLPRDSYSNSCARVKFFGRGKVAVLAVTLVIRPQPNKGNFF